MSGIIGHLTYAILAAKAVEDRKLPLAPIIERHFSSYLAGAYLGCDVQTLPAAVCRDTGENVGYGSGVPKASPITGGAVTPWVLTVDGTRYTPGEIHQLFYGRAHLVFGFSKQDEQLAVLWEDLPGYCAAVVGDAINLFGPGERQLAYLFGWMTHIAGDCLIKSVRPGVTLHLLDGKYTPRNRPIQDLVCFHEVGREELKLNWPALLSDLVDTPVETIQPHFMRVGRAQGDLADRYPDGWIPGRRPLLQEVLAENRRYQRIRNARLLEQLELSHTSSGLQCSEQLRQQTGVLDYAEMLELAREAGYRRALWQIAEATVRLFVDLIEAQPLLQDFPTGTGPTWEELVRRWRSD